MFLSIDRDQEKAAEAATIETIQQARERISTRHDHNLAASLGDWGAMGGHHSRAAPIVGAAQAPGSL
jgi:hypothetical protein